MRTIISADGLLCTKRCLPEQQGAPGYLVRRDRRRCSSLRPRRCRTRSGLPDGFAGCRTGVRCSFGSADLSIDAARDALVGYTIFNDVSYREIQRKDMAFGLGPTKGKDADDSNVLGAWIVTADEVGDPQDLGMLFT